MMDDLPGISAGALCRYAARPLMSGEIYADRPTTWYAARRERQIQTVRVRKERLMTPLRQRMLEDMRLRHLQHQRVSLLSHT
jgi:hypothetical protein